MSVKINYSKITNNKPSANVVLFTNEKFKISALNKFLSIAEYKYISDLLKNSDLKKNLLVFELTSKKKKRLF